MQQDGWSAEQEGDGARDGQIRLGEAGFGNGSHQIQPLCGPDPSAQINLDITDADPASYGCWDLPQAKGQMSSYPEKTSSI